MAYSLRQFLDKGSGSVYFVQLRFHANEQDFETSTFDIDITDGTSCCWRKVGQGRTVARTDWMQHVHKALTEPNAEQYEFKTSKAADGSLKLTIQWRQGSYNASAAMTLPQSEDADGLRAFLSSLYSSFAALKAAHDEFEGRSTALQSEIQKLDQAIQVANASAQREGEVFAKIVGTLNTKKRRLRELRNAMADLERRLQEADYVGSETDDGAGSRHGGSGADKGYSAATEPSEESGEAGAQQAEDEVEEDSARGRLPLADDAAGEKVEPASSMQLDDGDALNAADPAQQEALLNAPTQPLDIKTDVDMAGGELDAPVKQEAVDRPRAAPAARRRRR